MMLCFGFILKTILITLGCFSSRWAVLTGSSLFLLLMLPHQQVGWWWDDGALGRTLKKRQSDAQAVRSEEKKKSGKNNSANTKVKKKAGGNAPGALTGIPLQPLEEAVCGGKHGGADIHHAVSGKNHTTPRGHAQKEWWTVEDPTQEQFFSEGLQPIERTHAETGWTHEKERAAERSCCGLTAACNLPLSPAPVRVRWRQMSGEWRTEIVLGKRWEWGEGVLHFVFVS